MLEKIWLRVAAAAVGLAVVLCLFAAWRDVRQQQAELQAQLKNAQQEVQAADAREQGRKVELDKELTAIARQRKAVSSPQQVIQALPGILPLPKPLVVSQDATVEVPRRHNPGVQDENAASKNGPTAQPTVQLPAEDLKPLYDYALGCKACQEELAAARADLKDEKVKSATLGRERDDALRVSRGGSVIQRMVRAAKWFVIGAAAGAVAAKCAH